MAQPSVSSEKQPIGCHIKRTRLPEWLTGRINSGEVPGLEWTDKKRGVFKIPWKHSGKHDWTPDQSQIFKEWALHTGKYKEGDKPNYAKWKTNFRCALYKAEDIVYEKEPFTICNIETHPYRIFRFIPKKTRSVPIDIDKCEAVPNTSSDNIPIFVSNYDCHSSSGSTNSSQSTSQAMMNTSQGGLPMIHTSSQIQPMMHTLSQGEPMMHTTSQGQAMMYNNGTSFSGMDQSFQMGTRPAANHLDTSCSQHQNNAHEMFSLFAMDDNANTSIPLSPSYLLNVDNQPQLFERSIRPTVDSVTGMMRQETGQINSHNFGWKNGFSPNDYRVAPNNNGMGIGQQNSTTGACSNIAFTQNFNRLIPSNNRPTGHDIRKPYLNCNSSFNHSANRDSDCSATRGVTQAVINRPTPNTTLFHKFSEHDNSDGSFKEVMKVEYMCKTNNVYPKESSAYRFVPKEDGKILRSVLLGTHNDSSMGINRRSSSNLTQYKYPSPQGAAFHMTNESYSSSNYHHQQQNGFKNNQSKIENPTLGSFTSLEKVQAFNINCKNVGFSSKKESETKKSTNSDVKSNHLNSMFHCESSNSSDTSASVDMSVAGDDSFTSASLSTSLSEHLCQYDKGIIIELFYRQSRKCQWHVTKPEGCRLIYKVLPEGGPPELTYKVFGYKFNETQVLEMPSWPAGFGNEVVCSKANQVLQNLQRGMILQVSDNGDIYATRLCKTSIYCSNPVGDNHTYRLERDENQKKIKVFDYAKFESDFEDYNKSRINIPSASIHFYFGQRSTAEDRDKVLVMAKITSCKALSKINTEDGQQQCTSIHISHPDQYDTLGECMKKMHLNKNG